MLKDNLIHVSIVIVNYNTYDLIVDCIRSIIEQTVKVQFEVIVIDNASSDRRIESIETLDSRVKLIQSKENLGFGRANNLGMLNAMGEYFLLLNSDTLIIENAIDRSIACLSAHPDYSVLGIDQTDEFNKSIVNELSYTKSFTLWNYLKDAPLFSLLSSKSKKAVSSNQLEPFKVNQLSGAFILLRKEVFETTSGFDPDFFMYYEETEWCERIRQHFNILYHPGLRFIHLHGKSSPREIMTKQMHLSAGLFWYKRGIVQYIIYLMICYLVYLPSWIVIALSSRKRKSHFSKYIKIYVELFGYFIFEILKSSNRIGAREQMLKLKQL